VLAWLAERPEETVEFRVVRPVIRALIPVVEQADVPICRHRWGGVFGGVRRRGLDGGRRPSGAFTVAAFTLADSSEFGREHIAEHDRHASAKQP
jgi:hypothetical protein